jgi:hypothetical protein
MDEYRDQALIRSSSSSWSRLSFFYPADSSFVLEKMGDFWTIGGKAVDSMKVVNFLRSLERLSSSDFYNQAVQAEKPTHKLIIEGSVKEPIEITAYPADVENGYTIESSQNKEARFSGKASGLFERVFKGKSALLLSE